MLVDDIVVLFYNLVEVEGEWRARGDLNPRPTGCFPFEG